jgi:predicted dithiol-disulfide oxidoreductase (DUF899 family)
MGWTFHWGSSWDGDFNYYFNTSFTEEQQRSGRVDYNYQKINSILNSKSGSNKFAALSGTDVLTYRRELPGMSSFLFSNGVIYYTYFAYSLGLDALWGDCISGSTRHLIDATKTIYGLRNMVNTQDPK